MFNCLEVTGLIALSLTLSTCVGAESILPAKTHLPQEYKSLASGPLRPLLLPNSTKPRLCFSAGETAPAERLIAAVEKYRLADCWMIGGETARIALDISDYVKTGYPIFLMFRTAPTVTHQIPNDPKFKEIMGIMERDYANNFYSVIIAEWDNCLNWPTGLSDIFGVDRASLGKPGAAETDRRLLYDAVQRAFVRMDKSLRNTATSWNGYGLHAHMACEAGAKTIAIETGENIPATQVQRAFARGASRQFGTPWLEDISLWFRQTIPSSDRGIRKVAEPFNIQFGRNAGHSVNMAKRMSYTAWFSGPSVVMHESSGYNIIEVPFGPNPFLGDMTLPSDVKLTSYGRDSQQLFSLMKSRDSGVPYTPFAIMVSKYAGRNTTWGAAWQNIKETTGDKITQRFFDAIYTGAGRDAGNEERYLCPTPYGDTFDVIVNDAKRDSWSSYPVILAVGDIYWTDEDIAYLKNYIENGGILCLNEMNVGTWDRKYLGLAADGFTSTNGATTVLSGPNGRSILIRRDVGKGHIFVSARNPETGTNERRAFPKALLAELAKTFVPFEVTGDVQYMINRTPGGWAIMLVNNAGWSKLPTEKPVVDRSKTARVEVSWKGDAAKAEEWLSGKDIKMKKSGDRLSVKLDLPPGEMAIVGLQ